MGVYVNGGSLSMAYVINGHLRNELYFNALRAKLLGAVYCNRSCLWVCGCVCVYVCYWVC